MNRTRWQRAVHALPGAIVMTLVIGGMALAFHTMTRLDPNDTVGNLDVRKWSFRVAHSRNTCRADFFGDMKRSRWNSNTAFTCGLDYAGNGDEDGFIRTRIEGNVVIGEFFEEEEEGNFVFQRKVPAEINGREDFAIIKLPRNEIMSRSSHIRWRGVTLYDTKGSPCSKGCYDNGPDSGGWYRYNY